jgi:bifunctional non-homologous end joining protein LigD
MPRSASETLGFIKPELPTLVPQPPTGEGWIHEIKYDGYRTLIVIDRGHVRAFTRNGNDWSRAYGRVVEACGKLACKAAVLDGEMVVQDEHGLTDFNALRSAIYRAPHRLVSLPSISCTSTARIYAGSPSWNGEHSCRT